MTGDSFYSNLVLDEKILSFLSIHLNLYLNSFSDYYCTIFRYCQMKLMSVYLCTTRLPPKCTSQTPLSVTGVPRLHGHRILRVVLARVTEYPQSIRDTVQL